MKVNWAALLTAVILGGWSWGNAKAQQADPGNPTVKIIQTIGCATVEGTSWFITNATDPAETKTPFTSDSEVSNAKNVPLGSKRFHLIGVAEFLNVEGLLKQFQRSEFTTREFVNASGQLVAGQKVAVKGLFIENNEPKRINLTSVINLAEFCS